MRHDLHDYMSQLSVKMDAEYSRIRKSAAGDPGTAGDEGEENWAQLLREWLPPAYRVVTKGQLIDGKGQLSPQVDVIVLKPSYPAALHHKKKYFIAGVAAVFECKLTLKRADLSKATATCVAIKRLSGVREGTPYKELMTGPIYGVLAHSHQWRGPDATQTIDDHLVAADSSHVGHPRETLDLVCISNLASWVVSKSPLFDPQEEIDDAARAKLNPKGVPATTYMCHAGAKGAFADTEFENFTPVGVFVSQLLVKLAWDDVQLRDIASYFLSVEFSRSAVGQSRHWDWSVYSVGLRRKLSLSRLHTEIDWNEWSATIE
ncbi:DUF6602 domain-containing protein [Thiohalobacter thiocyanaticus]|nr:DUF6602 domain-containing protein [Thiohalobacter thiocyanaticus]